MGEIEVQDKLEEFFKSGRGLNFKKGDILIEASSVPNGIYYIQKGYVRMFSMSASGEELTLNIFKKGSYLPMSWALGNEEIGHDYVAMSELLVYKKNREEVIKFLAENNDVLFELTKRLVIGLSALVGVMEGLFFGNAREKVVRVIVNSAKRFGKLNEKGEWVIDLPLSHQDIGNMAGLTRETTSLEMKKLAKRNLICYRRRHIVVYDLEKLTKEVN